MSARQRERLRREEELRQQLARQQQEEVDEEDIAEGENEDEDSEEEEVLVKKKAFVFSESSSSSSNSSSEDEASESEQTPVVPAQTNSNNGRNRRQRSKKKVQQQPENAEDGEEEEEESIRLAREAQEKQDAEDSAFLDAVIAAQQSSTASLQSSSAVDDNNTTTTAGQIANEIDFLSLQDLDVRMLDVDGWIRSRFAGMQDGAAAEGPRGAGRRALGRNNHPRRGGGGMLHPQQQANIVNKRLYFCQQKDDWTKPPSFIAGGIGMHKTTLSSSSENNNKLPYTLYTFEWSKEYKQLQVIYDVVKHLGDPNYLVMFLANNPYHVEGFLELGMIFLRSGHVEKGLDCIRRCIFAYECYSFDPFPFHPSQARMDPNTAENRPYFQALFRYLQLTSRQGFHVLAVDIARILLALNPMDDLLGLLLMMDGLLLQAGKYEVVLQFCGVQPEQLQAAEQDVLPVVESLAHWQHAYLIDVQMTDSLQENGDVEKQKQETRYTVEHLANWWYSLALATFLWTQRLAQQRRFANNQDNNADNTTILPVPSNKIATSFLLQALERYPFVVEELLTRLEVPASLVQKVKRHAYFTTARQSIPAESYLHKVAECYAMKQDKVWTQKPEAVEWLVQTVERFLRSKGSSSAEETVYAHQQQVLIATTSLLQGKYATIPIEDFQEEFNRLPLDLQAIDEDLMDPRVLGGGARFPKLHQQLLQMRSVVKRNQRVAWFYSQEQQHQAKQRQGLFSWSILIDFARPLLQIFLLTLLPWVAVPRYTRRPPAR